MSKHERRQRVIPRCRKAPGGWSRVRFVRALRLIVAAAVALGASPAFAATYKWVDDKGVVHYTDKMPPDAVDKASVELSKEGVPLKRTEKALTPEQRRAIEQEQARQRLIAKQQEEIARRDRALVSSYTSEAEIDLARKRALQTIESVVQSALSYSDQLNKRKVEAEAKKVEFKGKPVVSTLEAELEGIEAELVRQSEFIAQKKKEAAVVSAKYDADRQRWRELVAAKSAIMAGDDIAAPVPGSAPGKAAGTRGSPATSSPIAVTGKK